MPLSSVKLEEALDLGAERKTSLPLREDLMAEADKADRDQDRLLKKDFQDRVFTILAIQLGALFVLMLLQGFRLWGFSLDKWTFCLLSNGTLVETFLIVQFMVKHLFPQKEKEKEKK